MKSFLYSVFDVLYWGHGDIDCIAFVFFFWAGLLRKALFGYRENLGEMRKEMGIGEIGNVSSRAFVFCDFARESMFQFFFLV